MNPYAAAAKEVPGHRAKWDQQQTMVVDALMKKPEAATLMGLLALGATSATFMRGLPDEHLQMLGAMASMKISEVMASMVERKAEEGDAQDECGK